MRAGPVFSWFCLRRLRRRALAILGCVALAALALTVDLQEQAMGVAEPRGVFERLQHLAPGAWVIRLVQQFGQMKMGLGRIGRIEQQERLVGPDGRPHLAQRLAGQAAVTVRRGDHRGYYWGTAGPFGPRRATYFPPSPHPYSPITNSGVRATTR